MNRFIEKIVFSGFVTAWRFAACPISRSPSFVNPTTDGVVLPPSGLVITVGSPPSKTATHEFVVPRSIPIILPILSPFNRKTKIVLKILVYLGKECTTDNGGTI